MAEPDATIVHEVLASCCDLGIIFVPIIRLSYYFIRYRFRLLFSFIINYPINFHRCYNLETVLH